MSAPRLAAFYFAHFAHSGLFIGYFPLYLAARGLAPIELAWVLALPQLARIVAPPAWGWLADRTGSQRGIVMFGCAAACAGFALLPLVHGAWAIGLLVAAASLLAAGALPLVEAMTLAAVAARPGRYGPIRLWGSLGFIATVLGGGAWLDAYPVHALPLPLALAAGGAFAAAALLPAGPGRIGGTPGAAPRMARLRLSTPMALLLAAGFCMASAHGTLYAFLSLHLERTGYSGTSIGLLWTLGVLAEIAVFLWLPFLFRRFSLASLLEASFACAVVRFLAIGWLAGEWWLLVAAQLLHAATFGAFHAASVAAVQRVFPAAAQARGQALFSGVTYGAGGAVGALAAGWTWQAAGAGAAFSLAALAGLVGLVLARRLKRVAL